MNSRNVRSRNPGGRQRTRSRRNALRTLRRRDTIGLLLLGKCESGKTALVKRWINNTFSPNYEPTIEDFYEKPYKYMGQSVNVGLIDMTGSWDFSAMMDLYLNRVDSVMFVYDVNDEFSLKELTNLHQRLIKIRGENHEVLITVVGTKIDTRQEQELYSHNSMMEQFAKDIGAQTKHILTSAKLSMNVQEAFEKALNDIVATIIPNEDTIKRLGQIMKNNESGGCFKGKSCTIS